MGNAHGLVQHGGLIVANEHWDNLQIIKFINLAIRLASVYKIKKIKNYSDGVGCHGARLAKKMETIDASSPADARHARSAQRLRKVVIAPTGEDSDAAGAGFPFIVSGRQVLDKLENRVAVVILIFGHPATKSADARIQSKRYKCI